MNTEAASVSRVPGSFLPLAHGARHSAGQQDKEEASQACSTSFLSREKSVKQVLNKILLQFARTEKNNSKMKRSYPLTL